MSVFGRIAEAAESVAKAVMDHTPNTVTQAAGKVAAAASTAVNAAATAAKPVANHVVATAQAGVQLAAEGVRDGADKLASAVSSKPVAGTTPTKNEGEKDEKDEKLNQTKPTV